MKPTDSLFTPAMTNALNEQNARALITALRSLADQLGTENLHRDPMKALRGIQSLVMAAHNAETAVVKVCRDQGRTWDDIASTTGITRQGALYRWNQ